MPRLDTYRHLNASDGVIIGIEEVAKQVVKLNYGTHRMLSALVNARRADPRAIAFVDGERDELADGIEALLEKGLF